MPLRTSICAFVYIICVVLSVLAGPATPPTTGPAKPGKPADRIVFVIDARAQMLNQIADAISEVRKGVHDIGARQTFNIVVSRSTGTTLFRHQLVLPNSANVKAADDFITKVTATDSSGLDAGVADAMRFRPQVIWIVADGNFEGKVIAAIKKANPGAKTRLNTVVRYAYRRSRADSTQAIHNLWRIAHENGGQCFDDDGKPIDEPAAPASPAEDRPPDASNIFRE